MNPTLKTSYIIAPSPPIMVYHNLRREEGFKDKKLKEFSFGISFIKIHFLVGAHIFINTNLLHKGTG
jgi:hypothetical protein